MAVGCFSLESKIRRSQCKPWFGRGALRIRTSSRSLGSPSGFHRSRELRTTFWCQIEFSLHFFGNTSSFYGGRFPFFLSRAGCRYCFKFPSQLGELLRTLLQASFQSPDFFAELLTLHTGSQSGDFVRRPSSVIVFLDAGFVIVCVNRPHRLVCHATFWAKRKAKNSLNAAPNKP